MKNQLLNDKMRAHNNYDNFIKRFSDLTVNNNKTKRFKKGFKKKISIKARKRKKDYSEESKNEVELNLNRLNKKKRI